MALNRMAWQKAGLKVRAMLDDSRRAHKNGGTNVPDEGMREHAYLVGRGVRSLAIVDTCDINADEVQMLRLATRLERFGTAGAIPFVCKGADGLVHCGYATSQWVLDLFAWLVNSREDAVPSKQRHRILGLLLGYSPQAIREFEEQGCGRLFGVSTALVG